MELDKIKQDLLKLKEMDYKELFILLVLNEKVEYKQDIQDITQADLNYLEQKYYEFIDDDNIASLLNEQVLEMINKEEEN